MKEKLVVVAGIGCLVLCAELIIADGMTIHDIIKGEVDAAVRRKQQKQAYKNIEEKWAKKDA